MRLYAFMQRLKWPRSYVGKIFLICFICTHIPLLAALSYTLAGAGWSRNLPLLAVVFLATLVSSLLAIYAMHGMLKPVGAVAEALDRYAHERVQPNLPVAFKDEAGRMMASVQTAVHRLDRTIDDLTLMSITDALTGARNRRWLNDSGMHEFERIRHAGGLFSLLVIDLDEFKQLNDAVGHSLGDQVLVTVVDAMKSAVRGVDQVVRTGGDEFCVFLPGADATVVMEVGERIRSQVMLALNAMPERCRITLSIGGATLKRDDPSFAELYRRADRSLYRAKAAGRNRISFA